MVKDHRTGEKTSSVQDVMDGDLDAFMEAKLRGRKAGEDEGEREPVGDAAGPEVLLQVYQALTPEDESEYCKRMCSRPR